MKEPARAKKLYNEKAAQEKRDARAMEKIEREQLKAEKAKEIAERGQRESVKGKLVTLKKLYKSLLKSNIKLHRVWHQKRSRNVVLVMLWVVPRAWRVRRHLYHTKPTLVAAESFGQESIGKKVCSMDL